MAIGPTWGKNNPKMAKKYKNGPKSHFLPFLGHFFPISGRWPFSIFWSISSPFGFRPVFHYIPGGLTRNQGLGFPCTGAIEPAWRAMWSRDGWPRPALSLMCSVGRALGYTTGVWQWHLSFFVPSRYLGTPKYCKKRQNALNAKDDRSTLFYPWGGFRLRGEILATLSQRSLSLRFLESRLFLLVPSIRLLNPFALVSAHRTLELSRWILLKMFRKILAFIKIKSALPPSLKKPKIPPPLKRGILWTWRFSPAERRQAIVVVYYLIQFVKVRFPNVPFLRMYSYNLLGPLQESFGPFGLKSPKKVEKISRGREAPKGPAHTNNTTALNSSVFYYRRSFLLSVAICCLISL